MYDVLRVCLGIVIDTENGTSEPRDRVIPGRGFLHLRVCVVGARGLNLPHLHDPSKRNPGWENRV